MSATCHPIPQSVAQDMLRGVVEAICERPGDTAEQRDARSRGVVHAVLGFEPRDLMEMMLAGMAVTHFHLTLDSARDAFGEPVSQGAGRPPRDAKRRIKSEVVALGRGMVGFMKELRIAQTRPIEPAAEVVRPPAKAAGEGARPPAKAASSVTPKAETSTPTAADAATGASWREAAPVPLLPPLRRGETSSAALLAVADPSKKSPIAVGAKPVQNAPRLSPHSASAAMATAGAG